MALFMIERDFGEALGESSSEDAARLEQVNRELGLEWVQSFLTADRTRTYCLYEAPNAEVLREHAKRMGFPADSILEVSKAL
jgi:hypothetical protein